MKNIFLGLLLTFISSSSFAASICLVTTGQDEIQTICDGKVVRKKETGQYPDLFISGGLYTKKLVDQGYRIVGMAASNNFPIWTLQKD